MQLRIENSEKKAIEKKKKKNMNKSISDFPANNKQKQK